MPTDFAKLEKSQPLFTMGTTGDIKAKGWIAFNKDEIFMAVIVTDDQHMNHQWGGQIWNGDAIQFGIDANGDGTNGRNKNIPFVGSHDAGYMIALTDSGVKCYVAFQGIPERVGKRSKLDVQISRNEKKKLTIYHVRMPWEEFDWKAWASENIGICVMINDSDPDESGQQRLKWGEEIGASLYPGKFNLLALSDPVNDFMTVLPNKSSCWNKNDNVQFEVAGRNTEPVKVTCTLNSNIKHFDLPASGKKVSRYKIILSDLGELENSENVTIAIGKNEEREEEYTFTITPEYRQFEHFNALIREALFNTSNELYRRHLVSLQALVNTDWELAGTELFLDENYISAFFQFLNKVINELEKHNLTETQLLNSKDYFLFAFKSSVDWTLQPYRLILPKNYTAGKKYPLIVDLHGSGSPYVMDFISMLPQDERGAELVTDNPLASFILLPWGRGNQGYRGYANTDVYDCIADVKRTFNIDADRIYLTGFSMGGAGTWTLAVQTPDIWAAAAECSGRAYPPLDPKEDASFNIQDLPFMIWHGDQDPVVPVNNAYAIQKGLIRAGNSPETIIVEGQGHKMYREDKLRVYEWLLTHEKVITTSFHYTMFNEYFKGRNGFDCKVSYPMTFYPTLDVRIEAQKIVITTEGVKSMSLDLHKLGLDVDQTYKVVWNGIEEYYGLPAEIEIK